MQNVNVLSCDAINKGISFLPVYHLLPYSDAIAYIHPPTNPWEWLYTAESAVTEQAYPRVTHLHIQRSPSHSFMSLPLSLTATLITLPRSCLFSKLSLQTYRNSNSSSNHSELPKYILYLLSGKIVFALLLYKYMFTLYIIQLHVLLADALIHHLHRI